MTVIRTERLRGRPVTARDGRFAADLFGRAEVGPAAGEAGVLDRRAAAERARAWAAHWRAHGFGLRVWEAEGRPIALAGLHFCVMGGRGAVEASFAVLPERWGQGLAREAMGAALGEAPGICQEVEAVVREENVQAAGVLRALGFRETAAPPGCGRRRFLLRVNGL
ncbi:MAG: GNAT family N-acetyltransferase [Pseudomonadota bacterium]